MIIERLSFTIMYSAPIIGSISLFMKIMAHLLVFALGLILVMNVIWRAWIYVTWQWICTTQKRHFPDGHCYYLFQRRDGWKVGVSKELKGLSLERMETSCSFSPQRTRENGIKWQHERFGIEKNRISWLYKFSNTEMHFEGSVWTLVLFWCLKKKKIEMYMFTMWSYMDEEWTKWFLVPGFSWSMSGI